jgi:nitrate/nitrite transporter NarK
MQIYVRPKKIFTLLVVISLLLAVISFIVRFTYYNDIIQGDKIVTLNKIFNVDKEHNIPTLYSSYLILFAAFISLAIYLLEKNKPGAIKPVKWLLLALILVYLSMDELENIHERFGRYLRETFHTTGWMHHVWIVSFSILVLIVFFYFLPFLKRLPFGITKKFVLAGFIYAGSAILGDLFAGKYIQTHPTNRFGMPYIIMYHLKKPVKCWVCVFLFMC